MVVILSEAKNLGIGFSWKYRDPTLRMTNCLESVPQTNGEPLSSVLAGFKRTNHLECVCQCVGPDFAFESLLHPVKCSDHA